MWNDRDCATQNYFICERPLGGASQNIQALEGCNGTIYLSPEKTKATLSSPGYPRFYLDNLDCINFIVAPDEYQISVEFESFVLEQELQCEYDFLKLVELDYEASKLINSTQQGAFEKFVEVFINKKPQSTVIYEPLNTIKMLVPSSSRNPISKKICGDWTNKLKLLRIRTNSNLLAIHFSSDYSHGFNGFKAKISLEKSE